MEDELEDGDLAYVVVEAPRVIQVGAVVSRALSEARVSPVSVVEESASRPIAGVSGGGASSHPELGSVLSGPLNISGRVPRRTGRVGAGQHSNMHHLLGANRISGTSTIESNAVEA